MATVRSIRVQAFLSNFPRFRALVLAAYTRLVWKADADPNLYQYRYKLGFDGMKNVFAQCNLGIPADGVSEPIVSSSSTSY